MGVTRTVSCLFLLVLLSGCLPLRVELDDLAVPVSAQTVLGEGETAEPFEASGKNVLWVHGLFGQSEPDVAALLENEAGEANRIDGFRVRQVTTFHDWLVTHLTLGLIRMKSVQIEGRRVTGSAVGR